MRPGITELAAMHACYEQHRCMCGCLLALGGRVRRTAGRGDITHTTMIENGAAKGRLLNGGRQHRDWGGHKSMVHEGTYSWRDP